MAVRMRKTVVIGIGGTGVNAALYMKREFQDYFGEVPPIVQIIGIDTDQPKLDMRDSMGNPVELVGNEYIYTPVTDPVAVLAEFPEIRQEFPEGKVRLRALLTGSGAVRPCGRLATLSNIGVIVKRIKDAHVTVVSATTKDKIIESTIFDLSLDPHVTVYIVCSLAGGTGAGAFLDLGYICRRIIGVNDRIIGVFLLPSIFTSFPATPYVEGNAYASLKELDYLMDRADLKTTDVVDYGGDFTVDWGRYQPFDQVYLVDNKNEKGTTFNALDQVLRFIGRALFANTNVVAEEGDDVIDNIAGAEATDEPWNNKTPYYAGLGASAIELPIKKIVELSVYEKLGSLISGGFLSGKKDNIENDATDFTQRIKIAELGSDDVIDDLIPPQPLAPSHLEDAWRLPNPAMSIEDWKKRELQFISDKYKKTAHDNYSIKLEDAKRAVSEKIESDMANKGGVDYTRAFVRSLLARLSEDRRMIEREKADKESKIDDVKNEYPLSEQVEKACRGYFIKPRIEKLLGKFERAMNRESEFMMEVTRRDFAIDFFAELIELLESYREQVESVVTKLDGASAEVTRRIKYLLGLKGVNSFTKYLDSSCLQEDVNSLSTQVDIGFVLETLRSSGEGPFSWAGPEWDSMRVVDRLREIVLNRFSELEERGMDYVLGNLAKKDKAKLDKYLREYLVERATPLWKISPVVNRAGLTEIFIFGVQDEENSIFNDIDTAAYGISKGRYKLASTGNKYSIGAFNYKLRVPAYLIEGVEDYKHDYLGRESRADFTHHIRRIWAETPSVLGDLFPERMAGTEEQTMYWAVAFSEPFELIWDKPGGHYFIKCEKVGRKVDGYTVKLEQGRRNAFEAFITGEHSREFFNELKEKIDAIVSEMGAKAVATNLSSYMANLNQMIDEGRVGKEIQDLLEEEFKAIERFIERITTKH